MPALVGRRAACASLRETPRITLSAPVGGFVITSSLTNERGVLGSSKGEVPRSFVNELGMTSGVGDKGMPHRSAHGTRCGVPLRSATLVGELLMKRALAGRERR